MVLARGGEDVEQDAASEQGAAGGERARGRDDDGGRAREDRGERGRDDDDDDDDDDDAGATGDGEKDVRRGFRTAEVDRARGFRCVNDATRRDADDDARGNIP